MRRNRHRFWTATAFAAGVLAAAASLDAEAATTLVIGNLLELTGPLSEGGPALDKANKLAVAEANRAATAAGAAITVTEVTADAQGDPQAALSAARSLIDKGASCLIGPSTTPESIAIANGLTIQKKITLWPTATSIRLRTIKDEGTIFRTVPPDSLQAEALADAIADALGGASGKTVSVAYRNEPYGEGLARSFGQDWQAKGGKVQGPVVFDPNQATYDSEAAQVVANGPDAYLVIDYPDSYAKFGASLARTGTFDARKLFVPDAMAFSEVPSNIPSQAIEGAKGTRAGTPTSTAAYRRFDELWKQAGGVEHYSLDANAFDAAIVCFLAAVAAKSSDPAAIQQHVRQVTAPGAPKFTIDTLADAVKAADSGKSIEYVGVAGPLEFAENGDPTTSLYDIFVYKDRRLEVVKQIDAKK